MAVNRREALAVLSERLPIRSRISSGIRDPSHHNGLRVLRGFMAPVYGYPALEGPIWGAVTGAPRSSATR